MIHFAGSLVLAAVLLATTFRATAGAQQDPVQPYRAGDDTAVGLNILPPGQGRYLSGAEFAQFQANGTQPTQNTDQMDLYDGLVQAAPTLTAAELPAFFKDASFGVKPEDIVRRYSPAGRAGVVVLRDRFQVPHVYGATRSDTMFGAGYVTGEDRLFMIDALRFLARGRISELLGASADNLATDRATRKFADYDEAELQAMGDRVPALDPVLGPLAVQDLQDFTAGVNAFIAEARVDATKRPAEYDALQIVLMDWRMTDSVALAALIGSQFSVGGGGQLQNARFLAELQAAGHSPAAARAIFDDFRVANDPEAPTATDTPFPFNTHLGPPDPAAVAMPDDPAAVLAQANEALPPGARHADRADPTALPLRHEHRAARQRRPLDERAAARGDGAAGRLLLARDPDGDRPPRAGSAGARRGLPGHLALRAPRPGNGLRLERDHGGG